LIFYFRGPFFAGLFLPFLLATAHANASAVAESHPAATASAPRGRPAANHRSALVDAGRGDIGGQDGRARRAPIAFSSPIDEARRPSNEIGYSDARMFADDGATPPVAESEDFFAYLRMIAGAFIFIIFAGARYLLGFRNKAKAGENDALSTIVDRPAPGQNTLVPRTLPKNPFSGSADLSVLGSEIEAAAAACQPLNRTVGLIYFEFPKVDAIERAQGAGWGRVNMDALAADFRRVLRATDYVAVLGPDQIVVVLCLLADRKDMENVAFRLSAAARRCDIIEEDAPSLPVGLAIWPIDGRGGATLIQSARKRYRELMSRTKEAAQEAPDQGCEIPAPRTTA
jgi:GGDEF domain-containing protein